ncbi:MAG: hypothetical protein ACOYXC_17355, partial [Candidatus Rifleibacteriota bacterium]
MQNKTILALTLALGLGSSLYAGDDFDMGKVQIIGKDAQVEKIDPTAHSISMDIDDRYAPMPELIPEAGSNEYKP